MVQTVLPIKNWKIPIESLASETIHPSYAKISRLAEFLALGQLGWSQGRY
jgi:hypothetical protein